MLKRGLVEQLLEGSFAPHIPITILKVSIPQGKCLAWPGSDQFTTLGIIDGIMSREVH